MAARSRWWCRSAKRSSSPDFSDYTSATAAAKAAEFGITATVIEKYSGSSTGAFISQSIEAGTVYEAGDILELKYSLGNRIVVSSFVGQTLDAIQTWAQEVNANGAKIAIKVTETVSSSPAGTIIYQDQASKEISYKKTIKVTVSKGSVVYVPRLRGGNRQLQRRHTARGTRLRCARRRGLVPVFEEEANSAYLPGEIWHQDISRRYRKDGRRDDHAEICEVQDDHRTQ